MNNLADLANPQEKFNIISVGKKFYQFYLPFFGRRGTLLFNSVILTAVLAGNIVLAFVLTMINTVFNSVMGVLQEPDVTYAKFFAEVGHFIAVITLHSAISSLNVYVSDRLGESLAYLLTKKIGKRWIKTYAFYAPKFNLQAKSPILRQQILNKVTADFTFENAEVKNKIINHLVEKTVGFSEVELMNLALITKHLFKDNANLKLTGDVFDEAFKIVLAKRLEKSVIAENSKLLSEDINTLTTDVVQLGNDLLNVISAFVVGLIGLYSLSGPLTVSLFALQVTIPAYMPIAMILYTIAYKYVTDKIGENLKAKQNKLKDAEGILNQKFNNLQTYAEAIVFKKGAAFEHQSFLVTLRANRAVRVGISNTVAALSFCTGIHHHLSWLMGLVLSAPKVIAKTMNTADVWRLTGYVADVVRLPTWSNTNMEKVYHVQNLLRRLKDFMQMMTDWEEIQKASKASLHFKANAEGDIQITDLTINQPDGICLVDKFSATIKRGSRTLLEGPSGSGKTTRMRAFSGISPFTSGEISGIALDEIEIISTLTYFPMGKTLLESILYPRLEPATEVELAEIREMMRELDLADKIPLLTKVDDWCSQVMSDGQRQRIMIIAALMRNPKPKFLIMDEATSRVDHLENSQTKAKIEGLINTKLPEVTILFSDHNPSPMGEFATYKMSL